MEGGKKNGYEEMSVEVLEERGVDGVTEDVEVLVVA